MINFVQKWHKLAAFFFAPLAPRHYFLVCASGAVALKVTDPLVKSVKYFIIINDPLLSKGFKGSVS